jgi:hypothetical protein
MSRVFTVEREPHNMLTNCYWFKITNTRTGNVQRHYAQEFVTGQMHYDEATAKFPNYVHEEVWKLCP